ncbi:MAG: CAP domain-containing protein [Candidatus Dormibacteraeota bacterium]|nr:CAP domain-containing protein [Candidatus Dormibacteraeota bacterium]
MTTGPSTIDGARWDELTRSAALVRADAAVAPRRSWRRIATSAAYLVVLGGVTVAALHAVSDATPVRADGAADGALFSLTNQDRASNGVRSMSGNGTLGGIGEGSRYNGCGFPVNGRSVDMIQRNYFAHPILNCGGRLVFSMMQAFGVRYQSAGENIGWNTYGDAGTAASQINSAFMNSPDHRANILNGNFTSLGVGSANSGSAAWSGGGGSFTGVWMFSEEFAQLAGTPPPPPPPPPPPKPKPKPVPGPTRNSAPPPRPAQPPVTTAPAPTVPAPVAVPATLAPTAIPTPAPTELPTATPLPNLTLPPLLSSPGGLLFNSVESVLESYLID